MPEDTVMDGKRIYLCLQADETLSSTLDTLDRANTQAAVFFTPARMEVDGDLLRRAVATGHSVGILADAADTQTDLLTQLSRANSALADAACVRTRLVMVQNADEAALSAAAQAGYYPVIPHMDCTAYGLRTGTQAETLVRRISEREGNVTVWLGKESSSNGLRAFLQAVDEAEGRCRALSETAG